MHKVPSNANKILYLTGFMGAGKTTAGRLLSERLARPFVDTDEEIEQRSGRSVREILLEQGEATFRRKEKELLFELTRRPHLIVSLGGGTLIDKGHQEAVKRSGLLIYLACDLNILFRRAYTKKRPLLTKANLMDLLAEREPGYRNADYIIRTDIFSPESVVRALLEAFPQ